MSAFPDLRRREIIVNQDQPATNRRRFLGVAAATGAGVWAAPRVASAQVAPTASDAPTPAIRNLAPLGVATMSSIWPGQGGAFTNGPQKGNDGTTNGDWNYNDNAANTLFHTNSGPAEWWEVDLGAPAVITSITLYNRTDGSLEGRAQNIDLSVDGASQGIVPGTTGLWPTVMWDLPDVTGQVVRVTNGVNTFFHLAEVEVYGYYV